MLGEATVGGSRGRRACKDEGPRLGEAFAATLVLDAGGCSALREALGWLGPASLPLEALPIGFVGPAMLARFRSEVESVLSAHWQPRDAERSRLSDVAPRAAGSLDERRAGGACSERSSRVLKRAGWDRWPVLLSRSVAELSSLPGAGRRVLAEVVAMCVVASFEAVVDAWVAAPGASDVAVVLRDEWRCDSQPILEALLEQRSAPGLPAVSEAADRLLRVSAPWALQPGMSLATLSEHAGDERDRRLFATRLFTTGRGEGDPAGWTALAEAEGMSRRRLRELVERGEARVRSAAAVAPAPLPWLVASLRRRLGPLTSEAEARSVLELSGVGQEPARSLALWLAGPYKAVPGRAGWLALAPKEVVEHTRACLAADGGVRRVVDVGAELAEVGVGGHQVPQWLRANGAVVVHDVVVSAAGALTDVIERILDAHGTARLPADIAADLAGAGREVSAESLASATRARRFRRDAGGALLLVAWGEPVVAWGEPATPGAGSAAAGPLAATKTGGPGETGKPTKAGGKRDKTAKAGKAERSASPSSRPRVDRAARPDSAGKRPRSKSPARGDTDGRRTVSDDQSDRRLSLWVRVDADVLHGSEAAVPVALVEGLGLARLGRRTFSSRWGPVALAYDDPHPTRGSVRAVALAAGARLGDTLLLGFSAQGDVDVEVRRSAGQAEKDDPREAVAFFSHNNFEEAGTEHARAEDAIIGGAL